MSTKPFTSEAALALLHSFYGLKGRDAKPLGEKVVSSSVYIADCGEHGKAVIKKSDWYSFAQDPEKILEKVYAVGQALVDHGVPLQGAKKNLSGKYVTTLDGMAVVVLEYKEGNAFSGKREEFIAAGSALAGWHKASQEYLKKEPRELEQVLKIIPTEKPYEESRLIYFNGFREKLLLPHECRLQEVCDCVRFNIELLDETIAFIDHAFENSKSLASGVLHNDFNWANGLYKEDGSFSSFLDIDQLGIGPFVWDLGNTILSLATPFLSNHSPREFREYAAEFLKAYHKISPLPSDEYALLLAGALRWDVMRILRSLRRHHYEDDRFPELVLKIKDRLITRLKWAPDVFKFLGAPI